MYNNKGFETGIREETDLSQLPLDSAERRRKKGEVKIGEKGMKYAIVESGGKQYKAVEGSDIVVDRLIDAEAGSKVNLNDVLLFVNDDAVSVGAPYVKGATVEGTVVGEEKGPKITVFKYRPKKHFRVKTGHRQVYTRIKIESIKG